MADFSLDKLKLDFICKENKYFRVIIMDIQAFSYNCRYVYYNQAESKFLDEVINI